MLDIISIVGMWGEAHGVLSDTAGTSSYFPSSLPTYLPDTSYPNSQVAVVHLSKRKRHITMVKVALCEAVDED